MSRHEGPGCPAGAVSPIVGRFHAGRALAALVVAGALVPAIAAHGALAQSADGPSTHLFVVTGLGGSPEFADLFHTQASGLVEAARERWGLPESAVTWLAEDPARDPAIGGRSTREGIEGALTALAGRAGPADAVLVVLVGHGTGQGEESRLNLPGPDATGTDLAGWLEAFTTQTVAVVNTASASGGFVPVLSGEGRIVVTATRSPGESERTYFPRFFVEAFRGDGADTDKDGRVSLLEAFGYARAEVARHYERENQLLTEHALLDDDGDGEGSAEPSPGSGDGALASRFFLAASSAAVAARASDTPELRALLEEKTRIETEIAALRARREEMTAEAYDAALEALLVELATTNRAIRELEDGS